MYRILRTWVSTTGDMGSGVVLLDDETRVAEYFTAKDFDILRLFVRFLDNYMSDVLYVSPSESLYLYSVVGSKSYAMPHKSTLSSMRKHGYLIGTYTPQTGVSEDVLGQVCDPSIALRYNMLAIVDTDKRLWFLDPCNNKSVRLSDICRSVMKNAIDPIFRRVEYILDDNLDFVHPDCFHINPSTGSMYLPMIRGEGKYAERY